MQDPNTEPQPAGQSPSTPEQTPTPPPPAHLPQQFAPQQFSPQPIPPVQPIPPGQPYPQQYQQYPPPDNTLGGLIPNNTFALISYYVGLFSLLPCFGAIPGIVAIVLGVKGLKFATEHPDAKGKTHAWVGIICGGFWALVYGVATVAVIVGIITSGRH